MKKEKNLIIRYLKFWSYWRQEKTKEKKKNWKVYLSSELYESS